jgi:hypothetical protein
MLAGIIALSGYLPLAERFAAERSAANAQTPIFMAHGSQDPVVVPARGEASRDLLKNLGYAVHWHTYPMPHSVHPREIADISAEIRDIAHHLRPAYLQEITLDRAIIKRCEMLGRRGVPISISCVGDFSSLSCQVSENLYRISQEAIANADRHAAATLITVRLTRVDNALTLLIADNGCGIKDVSTNKGVGLRIIEERVSLIGGKLDMASTASGTTITVTLELP